LRTEKIKTSCFEVPYAEPTDRSLIWDPKISLMESEYCRLSQESDWTAKKCRTWKETTNSVSILLHLEFTVTVVPLLWNTCHLIDANASVKFVLKTSHPFWFSSLSDLKAYICKTGQRRKVKDKKFEGVWEWKLRWRWSKRGYERRDGGRCTESRR
jgi:hypothetical protein